MKDFVLALPFRMVQCVRPIHHLHTDSSILPHFGTTLTALEGQIRYIFVNGIPLLGCSRAYILRLRPKSRASRLPGRYTNPP
jgi:hypothetical protein